MTALPRFDGPDCGVNGCAREVGHIGDHKQDPAARPSDDLTAAWEAAEAALPEGWTLRGVERDLWGLTHQPLENRWFAAAGRGIETDRPDYVESDLFATPALALDALTERLRGET